jgi:hypothetical protein
MLNWFRRAPIPINRRQLPELVPTLGSTELRLEIMKLCGQIGDLQVICTREGNGRWLVHVCRKHGDARVTVAEYEMVSLQWE